MGWGCLVTQRCSPGHTSTVRPGRRLPAPFAAAGVELRLANRDGVQMFPGSTGLPRRRGTVRARRCEVGWRLRALVKAGLLWPGNDAGATALHLLCSSLGDARRRGQLGAEG